MGGGRGPWPTITVLVEHKYRRKDRTIPENPVEISAIHLIYGVPIKTSHGANNSPAAAEEEQEEEEDVAVKRFWSTT